MCAAYNSAIDSEENNVRDSAKVSKKRTAMLVRTTILSAYYFVESYLNAVAFNYWWAEKSRLGQDDVDTLLELDSRNNRTRWLKFEDKTQKYPRIILKTQHSPLQPTNCAELKTLLGRLKEVRDAIVHQSPKVDLRSLTIPKVEYIVKCDISMAMKRLQLRSVT